MYLKYGNYQHADNEASVVISKDGLSRRAACSAACASGGRFQGACRPPTRRSLDAAIDALTAAYACRTRTSPSTSTTTSPPATPSTARPPTAACGWSCRPAFRRAGAPSIQRFATTRRARSRSGSTRTPRSSTGTSRSASAAAVRSSRFWSRSTACPSSNCSSRTPRITPRKAAKRPAVQLSDAGGAAVARRRAHRPARIALRTAATGRALGRGHLHAVQGQLDLHVRRRRGVVRPADRLACLTVLRLSSDHVT